jgi:hypothetical protein
MRPQAKFCGNDALLHAADVALQRIELDQQRGRIHLADVRSDFRRRRYHAAPRIGLCSSDANGNRVPSQRMSAARMDKSGRDRPKAAIAIPAGPARQS